MKVIYSNEDVRILTRLQNQLSEYDAALISRLQDKLNKYEVLSPNSYRGYIRGEQDLKTEFLNDKGRRLILKNLEEFYAVTMPNGIVIDNPKK